MIETFPLILALVLRVRSPKNGTFLERQIFVWHATIVIGSLIAKKLEKQPPNSIQIKIMGYSQCRPVKREIGPVCLLNPITISLSI